MLMELVGAMPLDRPAAVAGGDPNEDLADQKVAAEAKLRRILHPDQPFGPVATPEAVDRLIFGTLFDTRNQISEDMSKGPALIIGRRGAGKTAFLNSFHFNEEYSVVVSLQSDDAFPKMVRAIERKLPDSILAEEVSLLWTNLLWGAVFAELVSQYPEHTLASLASVAHYLKGVGVKQGMSYYRIMRTILKAIEAVNDKFKILIDTIEELAADGITFADAKDEAIDFMNDRNIKAIVLVDSLEQFPLDEPSMANTLTGLLRAVGRFNQPGQPCEIRCCLPSELYPRIINLSSNPLKDLSSNIVLNWRAHELLHLAALRYQCFLQLHCPQAAKRHFGTIELSTRPAVRKFWKKVLPREVYNAHGQVEDSFAYIMRHTQLLPRHLLLYLNAIAKHCLRVEKDRIEFTERAIVEGIHATEHMIVEEIFNGYRQVHPNAPVVCKKLLPNLPIRFGVGEFHKAFNQNKKHLEEITDYHDALALLMEIGAVGVVTDESDRYIEGVFEYSVPNRLHYRGDDALCIHPIFVKEYRVAESTDAKERRSVYPYGSQIDLDA